MDDRQSLPRGRNALGLCLVAAGLALAPACTKDFEAVNTNPNEPTEVPAGLLLRQVIFDYADAMSYEGFTGGANLGQYFSARSGFNAFDRGDLLAPQFGSNPWPALYPNLRDVTLVLDASREDPTQAVYEGPALVLRAVVAGSLTDIFGDVPYREAGRGRAGEVDPVYDPQEEIYLGSEGLLASLAIAVAAMDAYTGPATLEGDVLYGGDLAAWTRLANTLRLRFALRASDAAGGVAREVIADVLADGRFITEGSDDAVFRFGSAPNDFRFARARLGDFTNYLMSTTIDSTLDALDDPRERLWFRAADDGSYSGVRNGQPVGSSLDGVPVSLPGRVWREEAGALKFPFATAWETHFVLAEAAARGLAGGDAEALYGEGVRLAFEYWGVDLPADYLARPGVAYAGVEQIATQRWLASIGMGYQGWTVWRRTGAPAFFAPLASLNGGLIPVRFPYPADEQALNAPNYEAALGRIGGENSPNAPVWWDR